MHIKTGNVWEMHWKCKLTSCPITLPNLFVPIYSETSQPLSATGPVSSRFVTGFELDPVTLKPGRS